MSDKVRIYQLAKDLNMESKDLLPILDEMGVEYKSHSSTLEGDVADTIRQLVAEEGGAPEADAALEHAAARRKPLQSRPKPSPPPKKPRRPARFARRS